MWLFHLHKAVKNTAFFSVFPLAEFMAEAFCWLFPWNFKEKGISHLLWHSHFLSVKQVLQLVAWPFHGYGCLISIMKTYSLFLRFSVIGLHCWGTVLALSLEFQEREHQSSVMVCGCFISTVRWKYSLFLQFSPWRTSWLRHFVGYSLGTSRKKASAIF